MKHAEKSFGDRLHTVLKWGYKIVLCACLILFFWNFTLKDNFYHSVLAVSIIAAAVFIMKRYFPQIRDDMRSSVPFLLFLAAFISRYFYCNFMDDYVAQIYDFQNTLSRAQSGIFSDAGDYYRIYMHKFLYPFLLHVLHLRSQSAILLFQSVCVSFCPVILYLCGCRMANKRVGFLAAVLYILWPAQIVYIQIVTEEHVAAPLTCLFLFIVISISRQLESISSLRERSCRALLAKSVLGGVIAGLCAFFKDWGIVVITACVLCAVYVFIKYQKAQRLLLLGCILCMFLSRIAVQEAITGIIENKLQMKANNNVVVVQMYSTLDPNSTGGYNEELSVEYARMLAQNDYDFSRTNSMAMDILREKIRKDYEKMPALLLRKGKDAYSNNDAMFWWTLDVEAGESFKHQFPGAYSLWRYIDNVYYIAIVLCLLLSAVFVRDKHNFLILLCVLGGGLVSLLVESQGRYKYSIEPIWCISAAYGIYFLCSFKRIANEKVS